MTIDHCSYDVIVLIVKVILCYTSHWQINYVNIIPETCRAHWISTMLYFFSLDQMLLMKTQFYLVIIITMVSIGAVYGTEYANVFAPRDLISHVCDGSRWLSSYSFVWHMCLCSDSPFHVDVCNFCKIALLTVCSLASMSEKSLITFVC